MAKRVLAREQVLALLWLSGGLLTALTLLLPYRADVDETLRSAIALAALVLGSGLLVAGPLPERTVHAILAAGIVAVTLCTSVGIPEVEGVFYLLVLAYAAAFFGPRVAGAYLAACGAGFAVALAAGAALPEIGSLVPWTLVMGVGAVLVVALQAGRRGQRIAEALQATLLPSTLPELGDVELAARYIPAAREADVGGDLYDAFVLPGGRLALVIGDVAGKGLPAAAAVGPIRTGIRAHVLEGTAPAAVLDRVERLLDDEGLMVTLLVGVLDSQTGTLDWASAGHLPPVLVPADGEARLLTGATRAPLGVSGRAVGSQQRLTLAPGDGLVLVTDGLVETRGEGLDLGLERLRATMSPAAGTGAAGLLAAALSMGPEHPGDDIAVLVAARAGQEADRAPSVEARR